MEKTEKSFQLCGASIILYKENKVLLQKRKDNNCWGYHGGAVEIGEKVEDAAKRELLEETGLVANHIELYGVFSGSEQYHVYPDGNEVHIIDIVYLCNDFSGEMNRQEAEVTELKWFDMAEIPEQLSPPIKSVLKKFCLEQQLKLKSKKEWIAVIGSPRRGENTEKLVDIIIAEFNKKEIQVKKYYLDQKQMPPCTNCEYCILGGQCYIEDEITEILKEMKTTDGVILAAPSYNYNVTAQMKTLLDRSFSLNDFTGGKWQSRVENGKKAIVASVCKGSTKESMGYTTEAMRCVLDELGFEVLNTIEYYGTKFDPVGCNSDKIEAIKNQMRALMQG